MWWFPAASGCKLTGGASVGDYGGIRGEYEVKNVTRINASGVVYHV